MLNCTVSNRMRTLIPYQDSMRIIKLYNRLATAFYKFEMLWVNGWQAQVERKFVFVGHQIVKSLAIYNL